MNRTPEEFWVGEDKAPQSGRALPAAGTGQILRVDTQALFKALDAQRGSQRMTWRQVADELPGFAPGILTNLSRGPLIGFPRIMRLTQWLHRPLANFVRVRSR